MQMRLQYFEANVYFALCITTFCSQCSLPPTARLPPQHRVRQGSSPGSGWTLFLTTNNLICLKLESFQRFFKPSVLFQHDRAGQARSRWLRELTVATKEEGRLEEERRRREMEAREMLNMKLAREQEEKRMQDPEVVAFLRGGAQAATMWCHRTPLTK